MASTTITILQHLDEPERFGLWTLDEIIVLVFLLVLCVLMNVIWLGFLLSPMALLVYRKIKRVGARHCLGLLYWHCPARWLKWTGFPPSYQRLGLG